MTTMKSCLPFYAVGKVVKGFGRGSKELGIPTANFPQTLVDELPEDVQTGIYFGFASVDNETPHKMVMSIGWNPFYENTKKSMETHIMHSFKEDFYGSTMKVFVLGYIRPEKNFSSLDELVKAIQEDIRIADEKLSSAYAKGFSSHSFFSEPVEKIPETFLKINVNGVSVMNGKEST